MISSISISFFLVLVTASTTVIRHFFLLSRDNTYNTSWSEITVDVMANDSPTTVSAGETYIGYEADSCITGR